MGISTGILIDQSKQLANIYIRCRNIYRSTVDNCTNDRLCTVICGDVEINCSFVLFGLHNLTFELYDKYERPETIDDPSSFFFFVASHSVVVCRRANNAVFILIMKRERNVLLPFFSLSFSFFCYSRHFDSLASEVTRTKETTARHTGPTRQTRPSLTIHTFFNTTLLIIEKGIFVFFYFSEEITFFFLLSPFFRSFLCARALFAVIENIWQIRVDKSLNISLID